MLWAAACSRPDGLRTADGAAQTAQHQVPFHERNASAANGSPSGESSAAQDSESKPDIGLPFHEPSIPVGTLLTVRLTNPVAAENPDGTATFEAVVADPVVIDGDTMVPQGANVAGRVESARASKVKSNRGYVRLALDSIHLAGTDLPIQTSSLFVRGDANNEVTSDEGDSMTVIRLAKGHRLTFRLAQPVYVSSQRAQAGH